jgi:signal transduction histidine kinase
VEHAKVLVVSDDPEFVESLVRSWQRRSRVPEFAVAGIYTADTLPESAVAIVDGPQALLCLAGEVPLVIAVTEDEPLTDFSSELRRVLQVRRNAGWADIAAELSSETIFRAEAQQRVAEIECRLLKSQRFTALGHFISEARHGLGNALTSVLGNSELLLLEPGPALQDEVHGQLETIHTMSLRIYETLQRLTSLDMEMQVAERQAERDALRKSATAAAPQ